MNTYYLQLEAKVGVTNVRDMAKNLGVTSPNINNAGPVDGSFTLGAFNVSVLDVATAYATIAAHGKRCYAKPIQSITSISGKVPYTTPAPCKQVLDPQIADTITGVLEGVITSGTASANGYIGRTAAGKTGTTDDFAARCSSGSCRSSQPPSGSGTPRNPIEALRWTEAADTRGGRARLEPASSASLRR